MSTGLSILLMLLHFIDVHWKRFSTLSGSALSLMGQWVLQCLESDWFWSCIDKIDKTYLVASFGLAPYFLACFQHFCLQTCNVFFLCANCSKKNKKNKWQIKHGTALKFLATAQQHQVQDCATTIWPVLNTRYLAQYNYSSRWYFIWNWALWYLPIPSL